MGKVEKIYKARILEIRLLPEQKLNREEKIQVLQWFYLLNLVEDPQDGTNFDCAVIDALEAIIQKKWPEE